MSVTIFNAYNDTKCALKDAGIEDYCFEARQIIRHITGYKNSEILMRYNEQLSDIKASFLEVIVNRRITREPLQYILGKWSFYGLDFYVGEGVLIPRSDTETLVDFALEILKDKKNATVLDLCSGSGCIAIAVAKNSDALVEAVEKYDEAYSFLTKNIDRNSANVTPLKADIFSYETDKNYDIILSNPPYVSAKEFGIIDAETSKEPGTALYGGEDGLLFYRLLATKWSNALKEGGIMAVEVGFRQAEAVKQIFKEASFTDIGSKQDANGIQRVVFGTINGIKYI